MNIFNTRLIVYFLSTCALTLFVACTDIERLRLSVNLKDKQWMVLGIESKQQFTQATDGATLTFDIEQKRILGNTGCNNYIANFDIKQHIITINNHSAIRKICDGQQAMIFEFEFLRTIEGKFELISLDKYRQRTMSYKALEDKKYDNFPKKTMVLVGKNVAYFLRAE